MHFNSFVMVGTITLCHQKGGCHHCNFGLVASVGPLKFLLRYIYMHIILYIICTHENFEGEDNTILFDGLRATCNCYNYILFSIGCAIMISLGVHEIFFTTCSLQPIYLQVFSLKHFPLYLLRYLIYFAKEFCFYHSKNQECLVLTGMAHFRQSLRTLVMQLKYLKPFAPWVLLISKN